jgi:hypothetical protein
MKRTNLQTGPLAALGCAALLGLAACQNALEVELPGRVTADDLNSAQNASALANGVVLDFECGWTNYVTASNALSDQTINASNQGVSSAWYTRNILNNDPALLGSCEPATGLYPYAPLQIARTGAARAFTLIDGFSDALVPTKAVLKTTVKVYGAYATLALGEGFCEAVLTPGNVQPPAAALANAEAQFTEAITLATAANNTDLLNMARVGRARARLDQGNFAGARSDAEAVPATYVKLATRGSGEKQRWNLLFEFQNNTAVNAARHGSIAPNFRAMTFGGVPDPRPGVAATQSGFGNDGVTPFFAHTRATARDAGVVIASGREAQMIVAEAAARSGDLATARTIITARHALAGLPAYDPAGTATQNEVITQVIDERSRELFLEAGHRLNDMLRFRSTSFRIPFRGEPGSVHPTGKDHRGLDYGATTCIPLPLAEKP